MMLQKPKWRNTNNSVMAHTNNGVMAHTNNGEG
jgi:hypothetical protein